MLTVSQTTITTMVTKQAAAIKASSQSRISIPIAA
jgi:hypothetical protein